MSGEGGAVTILPPDKVSPAPVEQVSPPGSKPFVDSGSLPSDEQRERHSPSSHLASGVSQDLVGP